MVKNTTLPLSPLMKMADLMNRDFSLAGVLGRTGLEFGFGDTTVAEACRQHGVDTDTFLLICSVYAFDGYEPAPELLDKVDVGDIVRYLHRSHAYYTDAAMNSLSEALDKLLEPCSERQRQVLWKFFSDYKEELTKHFEYEENTVFPYVEAVLGHKGSGDFSIDQYEHNHSNVQEKLDDLKNLIMKYLPRECEHSRIYSALFWISTLQTDLAKHTVIEDDILIPIINRLEDDE